MTNIEVFMQTLPVMGMGMLGIFCVNILIILSVMALNKLTAPKNKDDK